MKDIDTHRNPAVAGTFYPAKSEQLLREITEYFSQAEPKKVKNVRAVISPHAGYVFSGKVAASAFNQIEDGAVYERVFLLASSHHYHFDGASVYCEGDFLMPYGREAVDMELGCELVVNYPLLFTDNPTPHAQEHSIEVQLPFLHHKLQEGYKIVPILVAASNPETCAEIASALKPYFTEKNLFVISTDFSHYPHYEEAKAVDYATAEAIVSNNPQKLLDTLAANKNKKIANLLTSLCGWTAVLTCMYMTQGDGEYCYREIDYRNSGDEKKYGDRREVVGYWAIAVSQGENSAKKDEFYLSDEDKTALLNVARQTIERLFKKNAPKPDITSCSSAVYAPCGAFVTLHNHGKLRGCIGRIMSDDKLINTIRDMAVSAAKHDYRFNSVKADELDDIDIEISVLSPLKKIDDVSEIELGKHGIFIRQGFSSGVFLPQVAEETGWNLEEYLGYCARDKAGIGWDGWKQADVYTFTATVFSENELNH